MLPQLTLSSLTVGCLEIGRKPIGRYERRDEKGKTSTLKKQQRLWTKKKYSGIIAPSINCPLIMH
jgi:hypothetical protein